MEQFISFTGSILTYSRFWHQGKLNPMSNNLIILFGHSNMVHLEVIIRNILSKINANWQLLIITSQDLSIITQQLSYYLDNNIRVVTDDCFFENNNLNLNYYHQRLSDIKFWEQFGCQKFMIVHPDCLILENLEQLEKYQILNTYSKDVSKFSFYNLNELGNGGIILRSLEQIRDSLKIDYHSIPRIIDQFMITHKLSTLPEFFYYYDYQSGALVNILQTDRYWVHCPWRVGFDWLTNQLAPSFNILNDYTILPFFQNRNSCYRLVNLSQPINLDQLDRNWYGICNHSIINIDLKYLVKCLGWFSYSNLEQDIIIKINSQLNYLVPYLGDINQIGKYSTLDNIDNNKIDYIFVNTILELENLIIAQSIQYPMIAILPIHLYQQSCIKCIRLNDYGYFGYYKKIPCLFLGPYCQLSIDELFDKMINYKYDLQSQPIYLNQNQHRLDLGYLPNKLFDNIISGSNIITNNPIISDYLGGKIIMIQDYLNKKYKFSSFSWLETMSQIRSKYSRNHFNYIIKTISEKIDDSVYNNIVPVETNKIPSQVVVSGSELKQISIIEQVKYKPTKIINKTLNHRSKPKSYSLIRFYNSTTNRDNSDNLNMLSKNKNKNEGFARRQSKINIRPHVFKKRPIPILSSYHTISNRYY